MSRRFGRGFGQTLAAAGLLLAVVATSAARTAEQRLGERLYREGLNARDEPIRALVGMPPTPLTGAPAACGACHAWKPGSAAPTADAAPDLRWSALIKATADRGDPKPYTEQSFGRAVNEGFGLSGNPIGTAMPRYSLSRSEIAALVAFLKSQPAEKK